MDTLARRVEGLKQAFINLTTSASGGGIGTLLKDIVSSLTWLLQKLNSFAPENLGLVILMNVVAFKGPAFINSMMDMSKSVMNFGRAVGTAGRIMAGANVFILIASVIYQVAVAMGTLRSAQTKTADEVGNLNKQLEAQTELYSRQEEGLKLVDKMASAYRTLTDQMNEMQQAGQQNSDDYKTRLEERNEVEKVLINILGEEQVQELENAKYSQDAVDKVKKARTDANDTLKGQIKKTRQAIQDRVKDMLNATDKNINLLNQESAHWALLAGRIFMLGYPLKAIQVWLNEVAVASDNAMASILEGIANVDNYFTQSKIAKIVGQYLPMGSFLGWASSGFTGGPDVGLTALAQSLRDSAKKSQAANDKIRDSVINDIQVQTGEMLKQFGVDVMGNNTGSYNPTEQTQLGGSNISDDAGSGSGSGSKRGSSGSSQNKPMGPDGIPITVPTTDNFLYTGDGPLSSLNPDLHQKLRALDEMYWNHTQRVYGQGEHLNVTSGYRSINPRTGLPETGNHGRGFAFDVAGGQLDSSAELRRWLEGAATYVGLRPWDEYDDHPKDGVAPNIHFDNTTNGTDTAPSLASILGGSVAQKLEYVDNSPKRQLYDTLRSLGLSDRRAWAAMAGIGGESGFDPAAIQKDENGNPLDPNNSSTGIGLMQWTDDRHDALVNFAQSRGKDWRDLETQLLFIKEEFSGSQAQYWEDFLKNVPAFGAVQPEADVTAFVNAIERPGIANISGRMPYYYDVSSHYANGMSLYDSDPSKSKAKQKTPEEIAKERADALKKYYDALNKALDGVSKSIEDRYKAVIQDATEDQKYFGMNLDNTTKQLQAYSNQFHDTTDLITRYQKAITAVAGAVNPDEFKRLTNGENFNEFWLQPVEEQQKFMAGLNQTSDLYKPIITQLNELISLEQKLSQTQQKTHQLQMQWADTEQKYRMNDYDEMVKNSQNAMSEFEATHGNELMDDYVKNYYEQQHLEDIARFQRQKYEQMQEVIRDDQGRALKDAMGNERRYGTPEEIEKQRLAWLNADKAAKQYAETLKNDVTKSLDQLADSVLLSGNNIRDEFKKLWRDLASDALMLIFTGGKQGTGSVLGNILRRFLVNDRQDTVKMLNQSGLGDYTSSMSGNFAYNMTPYMQPFDWKQDSMRKVVGWAEQNRQAPVRGVPLDEDTKTKVEIHSIDPSEAYRIVQRGNPNGGYPADATPVYPAEPVDLATAFSQTYTPMNPMPVQVMNMGGIGNGTAGNLARSVVDPNTGAILPAGSQFLSMYNSGQFGQLGAQLSGATSALGQFSTRYNWGMPMPLTTVAQGGGWGSMALASKIGLIGMGLPLLFSLFRHHASGGEIDEQELAVLGEGNKKEYVIPTEQNQSRGMMLWRKAGQDLGVLSKGTQIAPDFKNKELAQNGVVSTSVRQSAIYMDEMRQQNKTLLNILASIANNQQNSDNNGTAIVQPVVMKQDMDINSFTKMYQKGKAYNYIK